MAEEGFLDAPGAGCSDSLVDRECLPQAGGSFAGFREQDAAWPGGVRSIRRPGRRKAGRSVLIISHFLADQERGSCSASAH
jgi:hypothetical protein